MPAAVPRQGADTADPNGKGVNDIWKGMNGRGICREKNTEQEGERCEEKLGRSLSCPPRRGAARAQQSKETASFQHPTEDRQVFFPQNQM